jgi:hypothetical protein
MEGLDGRHSMWASGPSRTAATAYALRLRSGLTSHGRAPAGTVYRKPASRGRTFHGRKQTGAVSQSASGGPEVASRRGATRGDSFRGTTRLGRGLSDGVRSRAGIVVATFDQQPLRRVAATGSLQSEATAELVSVPGRTPRDRGRAPLARARGRPACRCHDPRRSLRRRRSRPSRRRPPPPDPRLGQRTASPQGPSMGPSGAPTSASHRRARGGARTGSPAVPRRRTCPRTRLGLRTAHGPPPARIDRRRRRRWARIGPTRRALRPHSALPRHARTAFRRPLAGPIRARRARALACAHPREGRCRTLRRRARSA